MRIINTTTTLGALALVTSVTLAACGNDQTTTASGNYCAELKTDKAYFQSVGKTHPDLSKVDEAFTRMHALAASAPVEVADDWAAVDDAVLTIQDGMKDAGLTFDDLTAIQDGGDLPADVDLAKVADLGPKFEALTGGQFDTATKHIADHAKDTCGFDLVAS